MCKALRVPWEALVVELLQRVAPQQQVGEGAVEEEVGLQVAVVVDA